MEIDNLHQVIDDLKLQLEVDKNKLNDLNEIILNKDQAIKSLENNTDITKKEKNNKSADTGTGAFAQKEANVGMFIR